jgi:hypothetical protein
MRGPHHGGDRDPPTRPSPARLVNRNKANSGRFVRVKRKGPPVADGSTWGVPIAWRGMWEGDRKRGLDTQCISERLRTDDVLPCGGGAEQRKLRS